MAMVATAKFPERNERIISLYRNGLSFDAIAAEMGVTRNVVAGVIHRNGVATRGGQRFALDDLTGRKFGRLTVLERGPNVFNRMTAYHCKCSCGRKSLVQGNALRSGNTKSCGCLRIEALRSRAGIRRPNPNAAEIIKLREWGWTYAEISQALDVSRGTVWRVLSQETADA